MTDILIFSETECACKIVDWFTILLICMQ